MTWTLSISSSVCIKTSCAAQLNWWLQHPAKVVPTRRYIARFVVELFLTTATTFCKNVRTSKSTKKRKPLCLSASNLSSFFIRGKSIEACSYPENVVSTNLFRTVEHNEYQNHFSHRRLWQTFWVVCFYQQALLHCKYVHVSDKSLPKDFNLLKVLANDFVFCKSWTSKCTGWHTQSIHVLLETLRREVETGNSLLYKRSFFPSWRDFFFGMIVDIST